MKSTDAIAIAVASVLFCLLAGAAAQQDFVIHQDVPLVLLDVGVTDHTGNFVPGLSKESFSVFDEGKQQPIAIFDNTDVPVTLGILVDESESMTPKRSAVLAAAETLIAEGNPHDAVFVLNFNEEVKRGLPASTLFSGNISQLRSALNRGTPQGRTALYDAVTEGLDQLDAGKHERKALVVISDGGDNASRHKRAEMLARLERSDATVFGIGIYTEGDPEADPAILTRIARASGGEALFPREPNGMTAACRRIAKEIRTRYVIGYRPPEGTAGALRHIKVRVSGSGAGALTVLARSAYRYGETSDGQSIHGK